MHSSPVPVKSRFLTASSLRLCAILLMLCDHLWASLIPGNNWMTNLGRLAFPIFAFQISEGYLHTSDYKRYAKRLLLFALISEIPFNLFYISYPFFPFHQNVMFTLLLGLLAVHQIDLLRSAENSRQRIRASLFLFMYLLLSVLLFPDYGTRGVLTVAAFYLLREFPLAWLCQLIAMVLLNIVGFKGLQIPFELFGFSFSLVQQGFAVFALLPIWCYNGEKGRSTKYGSYLFYPLHMLILYFIRLIF